MKVESSGIKQVMNGKGWNRVIRTLKLTLEALWSVLWACFFRMWAKENEKLIQDDLKVAAGHVSDAFASKDDKEISSSIVLKNFGQKLKRCKSCLMNWKLLQRMPLSPTEGDLYMYMKLISILLRFTHALREGD